MLFNFFNKKPKSNSYESDQENDEILAKISYVIFNDSKSPIVDVELKDYDDQCLKSLADILRVLSDDKSLIETVDIIKSAMTNDGKMDYMIKLFAYLDSSTKNKLINTYKIQEEDEPCIKPSEIFLK